MGVVVSKQIFGGGVFSTRHATKMRMVGSKIRQVTEIKIQPVKPVRRAPSGRMEMQTVPPFIPKSAAQFFHPSGNSLCFGIQLAQVMGCFPIYAVGFTLQNGLGYHFGRTNPVTRRTTVYEQSRALDWCRWHAKMFPGMVQLDPTFSGPIYEVFPKANFDALQATSRHRPSNDGRVQPDADVPPPDQR